MNIIESISPSKSAPFYIDPKAKTSIFTNVQTREYPNIPLINGFLNHNMGISFQNIAKYKCVPYKTEQNQISAYLAKQDKNAKCILTRWNLSSHGWGRIQPDGHLSLSVMHRPTRHAFCEGEYLDFDMVNAHPAYLLNLLKSECMKSTELTCKSLAEYVSDPKAVRAQIMAHYGVSKDVAKQLPIRILNGGEVKQWRLDNNIRVDTDLPLIKKLEKELWPVIKAVYRDNPQIDIDLQNAKTTGNKADQYINKPLKAKMRTVMATWCQTHERNNQERAILAVMNEYNIPIEEIVPCQDGFMIRAKYEAYTDDIVALAYNCIQEQIGIPVEWVRKPFDEADKNIPAEAELSIGKPSGTLAFDNDRACAEHILSKLTKTLKYCKGTYYMRGDNHVWISKQDQIKRLLERTVLTADIYRPGREEGVFVPYCNNFQSAKNVREAILALATASHSDSNFEEALFQSSLGYTLFENGYMNWHTGVFVAHGHESFDDDIIFTEIIPYPYMLPADATEEELHIEKMSSIKEKLFYTPFGEEMGNYYILNIARAMAGDCMKRFLFGVGMSNTGKSLITAVIRSACGGYYGGFNAVNLTHRQTSQDEAQQLRWALLLRFKRIIISNEIKKGTPLDGNMLKKLSSGGIDDVTGRGHGGDETSFQTAFLPICFANDIDSIKPWDDAVESRVRAIPYSKVCVDKPADEIDPRFEIARDDNLMKDILTPEFKMGFISILIEAYTQFCKGGRIEKEPEGAQKACSETFGENRKILDLFMDEYEFTNDPADYVPSSELKTWLDITKSDVSATKLGLEIGRYAVQHGFNEVASVKKKLGGKSVRVWPGIRRIPEENEDDV